jgi:hypothetical protein
MRGRGPKRLLFLIFLVVVIQISYISGQTIELSANAAGRTFDGIGGLSGGGATSRLLIDYPGFTCKLEVANSL